MAHHRLQTASPYLVAGFGCVLFLVAAVWHLTELLAVGRAVGPVVAFALDGSLALGLAYAGYWLRGADLTPGDRWQVWVWCLLGAALFTGIVGVSILVRAFEGRVVGEALFPLLIAAEAGGIAGVVAGHQTARARTAARRARATSDTLRERTRQLQAVLDGVEAAIWIRDTDDGFVLVNRKFRAAFGVDEEVTVDGTDADELLPPGVAERFRESARQVVETGEPVETTERFETPAGERTFLTRVTPLFEDGECYATCGVASDITEQKEYERTIERQNERLEGFTGVVSHDLRNPLAVAGGQLAMAREECDSEHLDHVDRALDRMEALIDDLLTLARGDETSVDPEPVALGTLARRSWETVETADATLVVGVDRTVYADEGRLKQVFENLVRNAVEHGGEGVTVTVGEVDGGFYVADDGPGIPEDERDEVFDAGYSTDETGTGFGLNIVEQVGDAHDWTVRVAEGPDGGARFEITGVEFAER